MPTYRYLSASARWVYAAGLPGRLPATPEKAATKHVEHILNKLGVGTRTQIAAWASEEPIAAHSPR
jgi:hypothetical protein